jgi:hypothetical protein
VGSHPSRQTASEEQSTDHHHDEDAGDESECTPLWVRAPEDVQLTREQHRIQAVEEG